MDPEDPDSDLDHFQNLIISSFYLFRHILKISSKSVMFLSYLVHKQTDRQTNPGKNIISLADLIITLNHFTVFCYKGPSLCTSQYNQAYQFVNRIINELYNTPSSSKYYNHTQFINRIINELYNTQSSW